MQIKPAKLLMALVLGLSCTAFASTAAFASDDKDKSESSESKDSEDKSKESKDESASTTSCKGVVVNACAVTFTKTTCTTSGSTVTVSKATKDEETDDSSHESKSKDAKNSKNDYDYAEDSHKDHKDRSAEAYGNKISICHRMGGAEVSLTVANDGWFNGHSKHALDTIGRCSDFDAKEDSAKNDSDKDTKDKNAKDSKISASTAGYSSGLTVTQIACLKGSTETTYTGYDGKGVPFTSKGAGLGTDTTSTISIKSTNQRPSRGGARTLH